jgi:hypothetical protein
MLDRELDADEVEGVRRSRRSILDYATIGDVVKLDRSIRRLRKDLQSSSETSGRELQELLDRPPKQVAEALLERLTSLERDVASHRRIIRWVQAGLAAAVLSIVGFIYTRGLTEGGNAIRMDHVERAIEEFRTRIYDRRSEVTKATDAVFVSTKDLP